VLVVGSPGRCARAEAGGKAGLLEIATARPALEPLPRERNRRSGRSGHIRRRLPSARRGSRAAALVAIYRPFVESTACSFENGRSCGRGIRTRIPRPWRLRGSRRTRRPMPLATRMVSHGSVTPTVGLSRSLPTCIRPPSPGVGRALYLRLSKNVAQKGFCNAYAGTTLPNEGGGSVASTGSGASVVHRVFKAVGRKFGTWTMLRVSGVFATRPRRGSVYGTRPNPSIEGHPDGGPDDRSGASRQLDHFSCKPSRAPFMRRPSRRTPAHHRTFSRRAARRRDEPAPGEQMAKGLGSRDRGESPAPGGDRYELAARAQGDATRCCGVFRVSSSIGGSAGAEGTILEDFKAVVRRSRCRWCSPSILPYRRIPFRS